MSKKKFIPDSRLNLQMPDQQNPEKSSMISDDMKIIDSTQMNGDIYRTKERSLSLWARLSPSLIFYIHFLLIIIKSGWIARRGQYNRQKWIESSRNVLSKLEDIGLNVEIDGLDNLRNVGGPCLIIGNHMSMMETLLLPMMVQPLRPVTFVVKQALLSYPVFKYVMRAVDPIAVTRTNPREDLKIVLAEGADRLKRGLSIIVFPQTTRAQVFDATQMSSLGVKLAKKNGVPIVPLALKTDAWQNGKILKDFGQLDVSKKAYFSFGEPFTVEGKGTVEQEKVNNFISARLGQWKEDL